MRIVQLETTAVRGLRDGAWTFGPDRGGPGHVTVVTGPPQAGLTTFLDAIALTAARLAVHGSRPDPEDALRANGSTAMIRSTWWLDAEERAFGGVREETTQAEVVFQRNGLGRANADPVLLGLMSRYDHSPETGKVISFPALRVSEGGFSLFGEFEADQQRKHLSFDAEKFAGLSQALVKDATGFGRRARFEEAQRLFGELCPTAALTGPTAEGGIVFTLGSGARVPLDRLSFSERNAFVLAGMTAIAGLDRSVVLLDTPEMGLPPGAAARWLDALRRSAPGAQWIVASRDPAVVAGVERSAVIELVGRSS